MTQRASAAAKHRGRKVEIIYQVTIRNQSKRQAIKKTTKENVLTLKNMKPGSYAVSYNVRAMQGKKILARSKQSPASIFIVPGS
jgi:hypothetical protein